MKSLRKGQTSSYYHFNQSKSQGKSFVSLRNWHIANSIAFWGWIPSCGLCSPKSLSFFSLAHGLLDSALLIRDPSQSWTGKIKSAGTEDHLFCSLLKVLRAGDLETIRYIEALGLRVDVNHPCISGSQYHGWLKAGLTTERSCCSNQPSSCLHLLPLFPLLPSI